MAEREPLVVIKKITVVAAGHHGGAWKVAFADFMTALMAFFLVMWLVSQSEEVKKNVADYFGTPSIIEYNFSNYGVELTLEKLFLDLINEPLRFFEQFIRPVDLSPNIMNMGTKKIVLHQIAEQLADMATNVDVQGDTVQFEIEDKFLFFPGTARPNSGFVGVMERVHGLTRGLEDSNVFVESMIFTQSVESHARSDAKNVAEERLDILTANVDATLESETVDIFGKTAVEDFTGSLPPGIQPNGKLRFKIKQKDQLKDGSKPRKLDDLFGKKDKKLDVYDNFVKQLTDRRRRPQSLPSKLPEKGSLMK